jgi:hypothetical protein
MSDETTSASTAGASDELGKVRFTSIGGLETFDGTNWVTLQKASDIHLGEILKKDKSNQP